MSKSISIDKIIDATLDGIKQSQRKYEKWTGGYWLCDGPEYLITINVAENIATILGDNFRIAIKKSKVYRDDESAWIAVCVLIRSIAP